MFESASAFDEAVYSHAFVGSGGADILVDNILIFFLVDGGRR